MAEEIEGESAGEEGQVFEDDFAEGDGATGLVEADCGVGGGGVFIHEVEEEVGDAEGVIINLDGG